MIWIGDVLVSRGEGGVYNERMLGGARIWDPYRSKFAAVFHVADYTEVVYAVEFAPRPMQDLIEVARRRRNVIPIMADAARPRTYAPLVETVDLVYQDVAQPDQAAIAIRNGVFLKPGGQLILMLKTRSVDVRK